MYEDFFGLKQRPFCAIPSADEFVGLAPVQDALDSLVHCVTQARGIAIVTAAAGQGKTTLCKRLLRLLQQNHRGIYLSAAGMETRLGLLQAILFELNMGYVGLTDQEARLKLLQAARDAKTDRQGFLLVIDEAQLLPARLFEELRALTEYAPDGENLIQIVLSGSFELEEKLADPAFMAFNQRVGLQVCLTPLSLNDSARYLSERFKACGAPDVLSMIDEEALELICRASDGNFRCLSQLADHACLQAFANGVRPITADVVRSALEHVKELPLRWNEIPQAVPVTQFVTDDWSDELSELTDGSDEPDPAPRPRRIAPTEQETDEFLIPEFLRLDDGTLAPAHAGLEVDADEPTAIHPPFPQPAPEPAEPSANTPDLPFAVFEVGAGLTEDPVPTASANSNDFASIDTSSPAEFPLLTPRDDSTMQEIPIIDRYALLDRLLELPEDRRPQIDFSQIPAEPRRPSIPKNDDCRIEIAEAEILELVQQIRRDIHPESQPQTAAPHHLPEPHFADHFEESFPTSMSNFGTLPGSASESAAADENSPPERRFEHLFTRLRLRRRKVEAEHQNR